MSSAAAPMSTRSARELDAVRRVAVIGGGYIGLEAAAVLRKLGKEVVLLEALDRVLARVAGPDISAFLRGRAPRPRRRRSARRRGRRDRRGGRPGRGACGSRTATRSTPSWSIVGIGIDAGGRRRCSPPARRAANGVDVDALLPDQPCRTSTRSAIAPRTRTASPAAAGSGSNRCRTPTTRRRPRPRRSLGRPEPYDAIPWFWSNQYDLKLQTVGLSPRP